MKQSTKLLSLVLALIMAMGCMSVIGNAALVKSEVSWDCIDDADLTPEQVADLALDLVDNDLLAGMEPIDLSILGELRLDSIDHIIADITDLTGGFVWTIGKGLLGDIGDMSFSAIKNKSRSGGDLNMINSLLQFLADNSSIISKVAYGIGTSNGISLGLVGNFLSLGEAQQLYFSCAPHKTIVIFNRIMCKGMQLHTSQTLVSSHLNEIIYVSSIELQNVNQTQISH